MARRRSVLAAAAVVAEATAVAEMSAAATSSAAAASSVAGVDGDSDGGGGGGPPGGAGTVVLEEDLPALGWAVSGKLDEDPEFCRILDKLMVPDLPPGMTRIPSAPSSFFAPGSKEARAFALVEQQQREQATQDASAAAAAASAEGGTVEDDNVATNAYNSGFVDPADLHLWGLGRVEKRNIDMLCRSGMCEHNYFGVNRSRAKVPKPIVDLLNLCRCNVFCYPGGEKRDSLSKTAENCAAAYQWYDNIVLLPNRTPRPENRKRCFADSRCTRRAQWYTIHGAPCTFTVHNTHCTVHGKQSVVHSTVCFKATTAVHRKRQPS
eukprot:m.64984 g.64984  ORF g.64984 m.64984 type:complete len:322 (+) comp13631_c0_seq1:199-1164(+)